MEEENLRKIVRLLCRENQADLGTFVFPLSPSYFLFFSSYFFFNECGRTVHYVAFIFIPHNIWKKILP